MTETPARYGDSNIVDLPTRPMMLDGPEFDPKYVTIPQPTATVIPFKRCDKSQHPSSMPSKNEDT